MSTRIILLQRLLLLGCAALLWRLGHLQLLEGARYRQLAEQNRLRLVPQPAPRGLILDRTGRRLAASRTVFQVAAIPQDLRSRPPRSSRRTQAVLVDRETVFARLSPLVGLAPRELERRFNEHLNLPFLPTLLISDIPKTMALRIEEEHLALPGIEVEAVVSREYPLGSVSAHLLGYLSQPSPEMLPTLKQYGVHPKDLVGRTGLERALDDVLRGQPGGSLIEVDHRGRQVRVVGHRDPLPGQTVVLSIDAQLEALIAQHFGDRRGACVVMRPQTGEVLAMVSVPGFDPTVFATQADVAVRRLLSDPSSPLMNRATMGTYLPGSIVKLITAMTALKYGVVTPATAITCPGYLTIGDRDFHCWNRDGHGPMTMREALMQSCNVYFMELGRRLGLERLRAGFLSIGFGSRTGWPLEERTGLLPFKRSLREGEVALLAMGQGEILITPMQAAIMASAIANEGWLVQPWVIKSVDGETRTPPQPLPLGWVPEHLAVVKQGMLAVVNDPDGTGIRAHSQKVVIAGKTGTAQTHLEGRTHGWFVGFCPADHPLVSMAIVAEYGGSGGGLPASIGKAICEFIVTQSLGEPATPQPPAITPSPPLPQDRAL